jgi:hypothetical protein
MSNRIVAVDSLTFTDPDTKVYVAAFRGDTVDVPDDLYAKHPEWFAVDGENPADPAVIAETEQAGIAAATDLSVVQIKAKIRAAETAEDRAVIAATLLAAENMKPEDDRRKSVIELLTPIAAAEDITPVNGDEPAAGE